MAVRGRSRTWRMESIEMRARWTDMLFDRCIARMSSTFPQLYINIKIGGNRADHPERHKQRKIIIKKIPRFKAKKS